MVVTVIFVYRKDSPLEGKNVIMLLQNFGTGVSSSNDSIPRCLCVYYPFHIRVKGSVIGIVSSQAYLT